MKKTGLTIFLIFVGCVFVFPQKKNEKEKLCIGEEEFAVYKLAAVGNFQNETIIFSQSNDDFIRKEFPDISSETIADYRTKNDKSYLLRCLERDGGKPQKLKRSTGGITQTVFSRIGFNNPKTEAFVYSGFESAGNNCGYDFIWLKKNNKVWEVIKRATIIIC